MSDRRGPGHLDGAPQPVSDRREPEKLTALHRLVSDQRQPALEGATDIDDQVRRRRGEDTHGLDGLSVAIAVLAIGCPAT